MLSMLELVPSDDTKPGLHTQDFVSLRYIRFKLEQEQLSEPVWAREEPPQDLQEVAPISSP